VGDIYFQLLCAASIVIALVVNLAPRGLSFVGRLFFALTEAPIVVASVLMDEDNWQLHQPWRGIILGSVGIGAILVAFRRPSTVPPAPDGRPDGAPS